MPSKPLPDAPKQVFEQIATQPVERLVSESVAQFGFSRGAKL
jgi:hypothetical protein